MFSDPSGRRRSLFTALGAGAGVVLASMAGLLIAGLLGTSPVPLPGLPGHGQGIEERDDGAGLAPAPPASPRPNPARSTTAPAVPTATGSSAAATATATAVHPGNKPTTHPGNGQPSRTK